MTLGDVRFVAINKCTASGSVTLYDLYRIECWRVWSFGERRKQGARR